MEKNELRRDPISGKWVIIENRKTDFEELIARSQLPHADNLASSCEYCEHHEHETPAEIFAIRRSGGAANEAGWSVRVVPETYPLLQIHGDLNNRGLGLYDMMDGIGAREIVVETPRHGESFQHFSVQQFEEVFSVYKSRILDLKRDVRFRYVLLHKLHGDPDDAKRNHAFSHILASPITPFRVKAELLNLGTHFANKERCLFCDIIHQEQQMNVRVVLENDHFIVLSPFASHSAFQLMILPKRHEAFFERNEQIANLAQLFYEMWQRLSTVLGNFRFAMVLHSGPNIDAGKGKNYWKTLEKDYHWHIELTPNLIDIKNFDRESGFEVNPIPPELATSILKSESRTG